MLRENSTACNTRISISSRLSRQRMNSGESELMRMARERGEGENGKEKRRMMMMMMIRKGERTNGRMKHPEHALCNSLCAQLSHRLSSAESE